MLVEARIGPKDCRLIMSTFSDFGLNVDVLLFASLGLHSCGLTTGGYGQNLGSIRDEG